PPPSALCGGYDESRNAFHLWQTFSISGASILMFDWNFLTNEEVPGPFFVPRYDYSFISIIGGSSQLTQYLGRDFEATTGTRIEDLSAMAAGQYGFQTGWHHSEFALSPGDYTLVLGVTQYFDFLVASALLVDNISVCSPFPGGGDTGGCFPGPGPFPAPQPATLTLLAFGLAGLGFSQRRRKKS